MKAWSRLVGSGAGLSLLILLSGCAVLGPGYIGPIQPPVLDIPVSVSDLRAIEYGDQILAFFTIGKLSTEGQPLKSLRLIDLYAGPGGLGSDDPNNWVHKATRYSMTPASSTLPPSSTSPPARGARPWFPALMSTDFRRRHGPAKTWYCESAPPDRKAGSRYGRFQWR